MIRSNPAPRRMLSAAALLLAALLMAQIGAAQEPTDEPGGSVNLPTATATIPGGPTGTPTRTPTPVPVLAEAIGEANLRSGPGLEFEIVGTITVGSPVPVVGRSTVVPWYLVQWEDDGAWVFDQLVTIRGDINTVPIVEGPTLPTQDPTIAAIEATATILIQTPGAAETATATALFLPTGVFTAAPATPVPGGTPEPTFTAPVPLNQPEALPPLNASPQQGGVPPGALIVGLGSMGLLSLLLGLLRRTLQ